MDPLPAIARRAEGWAALAVARLSKPAPNERAFSHSNLSQWLSAYRLLGLLQLVAGLQIGDPYLTACLVKQPEQSSSSGCVDRETITQSDL